MIIQVDAVRMDVLLDSGEDTIHSNKSRKYLLPCIKEYGGEFTKRVNEVFKVAIGIGDIIVRNRGIRHQKHLFILIDSTIAPNHFEDFLQYIKYHKSYQDDYVFGNIVTSPLHMFVIKFPIQYYHAFETFKMGDYSKMYTPEEIDKFFYNQPQYRRVLIRDRKYKLKFIEKVNKEFGTRLTPEDDIQEYDFPPSKESEIFNTHIKEQ